MKKGNFLSSSPIIVINAVVYTGNIKRVNNVLWVAHNLERLGGRVADIGGRAIYMDTGERPETIPVAKDPTTRENVWKPFLWRKIPCFRSARTDVEDRRD